MEEKTYKGALQLLKDCFSRNRGNLLLGVLSAIGAVIAAFFTPLITGFTVDYVLLGNGTSLSGFFVDFAKRIGDRQFYLDNLWLLAVALLAVTLFNSLCQFVRSRSMNALAEHTARELRCRLYSHLQDVPGEYHKHSLSGNLIQRCTSDVETTRRFVAVQMIELVRSVALVVVALSVMLTMNVTLTLASVAVMPVVLLFSYFYFKKVIAAFQLSDESEGQMSEILTENLAGVRVVRAFGQQAAEVNRFDERNRDYRDVTIKLNRLLGDYWGMSDVLCFAQVGMSLIAGVVLAVKGQVSVGTAIVFFSYTDMMIWPIRQLGRVLSDMGKTKVALQRLCEVLNVPLETEPGRALEPEIRGNIEFSHVCFGYDNEPDVLKDVSFTARCGQTVAILGSTGSGKSSLVQLLQRLYVRRSGAITLDGTDINDIERHYLRKNVAIVMQEPFLYSRTIIENIRMAAPQASDDEVFAAASAAAVHKTIMSFKDGYDTVVGERGVTLSGGEKQRVAIARMLLQNAPIIIFDDSMSAVDTETDAMIRDSLRRRRGDATTFIISHRIATLCEADTILVLENGRITQRGTHAQLMAEQGLYRRIAQIQSAGM